MCTVLTLDVQNLNLNLNLNLLGLLVIIPPPGLRLIVGEQPAQGALLGNLLSS